ncbi:MAG: MFS transporter [Chloroflexota bacterium]
MEKIRAVWNEYPRQFWLLIVASFIDRLGGALVFTFFSLYITDKFDVGLTQAGYVFAVFGVTGFIGSIVGGSLSDRYGRKGVIVIGLVASAALNLMMGLAGSLNILVMVAMVAGLFGELSRPAHQAMIADIVPEDKHAEGYAAMRVANNTAIVLGPIIGGLLLNVLPYIVLFIADSVTSLIMAGIVLFALVETHRTTEEEKANEDFSLRSYITILQNPVFVAFLVIVTVVGFVYFQMYTTLPVFLRDVHGIPESGYAYILSMNAAMVVLLQFRVTRWFREHVPLLVMAGGTVLYAVGFAMYGFVGNYVMFMVAMAAITVGEMMMMPTGKAFVTKIAPPNRRARYMAVYSFTFAIPASFATLPAGLVLDNFNPNVLWMVCGVVALVFAGAFVQLYTVVREQSRAAVAEAA